MDCAGAPKLPLLITGELAEVETRVTLMRLNICMLTIFINARSVWKYGQLLQLSRHQPRVLCKVCMQATSQLAITMQLMINHCNQPTWSVLLIII